MSTRRNSRFRRRAAAVVVVAVCSTVIMGLAALAIDMSMLYAVRTEAQRAADAGALAGAWKLIDDDRLKGSSGLDSVLSATRQTASSIAGQNKVYNSNPAVDQNSGNGTSGDIIIGRIDHPADQTEQLKTQGASDKYNSVKVKIRRDSTRNGAIPLIFGRIFGAFTKDLSASAVATAEDGLIGFKAPSDGSNTQILPIALDVVSWQALLAGTLHYGSGSGDSFNYNSSNQVVRGSDGIPELNIFPGGANNQGGAGNGGGSLQLAPGNWGTLNIGVSANSAAVLGAQIEFGITPEQMATFPDSEIRLGVEGGLSMTGDTGMSDGIKDNLTAIIGQTRTLPLYSSVIDGGNGAVYTIVGFAGVRIMDVKLTGITGSRYVLVQPAVHVERGGIVGTGATSTYNVYRPPALVR